MHKQLLLIFAAIAVIAATTSANAGTINFSGRSWTTLDNIGRNGNPNSFTTPDANTGVIGARYGADSTMATLLT